MNEFICVKKEKGGLLLLRKSDISSVSETESGILISFFDKKRVPVLSSTPIKDLLVLLNSD